MIHSFSLVACIRRITVSGGNRQQAANGAAEQAGAAEGNGADARKDNKGPSAVLMVQYGPRREPTNRAVEFVNAVNVRVPNYRWPMLQDKISEGMLVEISGRIQGVFRTPADLARLAGKGSEPGRMDIELVAERITPIDLTEAPYNMTPQSGE